MGLWNVLEVCRFLYKLKKAIENSYKFNGLFVMPVTIPTDLIASWRIQATMAFSIAYIYGHTENTTDLKTDLYLILAGDSAKEALKRLGIEISKDITKKSSK